MAEADRAGANNQLPRAEEDELAAAVTLGSPADQLLYGSVPWTQLFGSAASVFHNTRFSCLVATPARRFSGIPCMGHLCDSGLVAP